MAPDSIRAAAAAPADTGTTAAEPDTLLPSTKDGVINADGIRLRSGPGTAYPVIATLNNGTKVRIMGLIRGWLVVLMPDDSVGMVSAEYVQITETAATPATPDISVSHVPGAELSVPAMAADSLPAAERLFKLVNDYRTQFGLAAYIDDEKLDEAARLKAGDMVKNNYFNHDSPEYGTPFNMLRNMGVFYKTASENLACTANVDEAFSKMTGNLAHRTNLISQRYTHIGIGVADDVSEPGKQIIVLLFTEV